MASNLKVDIIKPTATNGSLSLKGDSGGSATTNGISIDSNGDVGMGTSSNLVNGLTIARDTGSATPTPVEMRLLSTTDASDFSTTDPIWQLSFYANDPSSGGPKIHAAIRGIADQAALNNSQISFFTSTNSGATLGPVFGTDGADDKALSIYGTDGIFLNSGSDNSVNIKRETNDFVIKTGSTEQMRIDSSGNVGIGLSGGSATNTLSVTGSANVDNVKIDGNTISSTDTNGDINLTPNGTGKVVTDKADINGGTIDGTTLGSTVVFPAGHIIQFSKSFSASTTTIGNLSSVSSGSPTTILTATINNVLASSKIFGFFYSGRMVLNSGQFIANTVTNGGSVDFDYQNQSGSGNMRVSPVFYFYDDSPATGTNSYDLTGYSNGGGAAAYWCETGGAAYGWMLFEVAQ